MGCPDRSCECQEALRTDKAFLSEKRQNNAGVHRAEYGIPAASRCKERATAERDVCFRLCFLFRPDGALKMSVIGCVSQKMV